MGTISTTLTLVDNFSSTFNKIVNKLKNAQGQGGFGGFAVKAVGALSKIHPAVNAVSSAMDILKPVVGAVTGAFNQLGASIDNCIQAYQFQSEQELALETIMRQRMGATEKEIQSIKDFAAAEQEAGIYGDELILAGAQELATFVSDTEALKTLSKAMNHMIAQHDKYNATAQTFITNADMIGKVMAGQTGALSKNGWVFSEEEKQILKTGSEMERAAALAKIITDNVTEMNYVLAGTDAGSMQRLSNTIGDLQENIGKNLQPVKSAWKNLTGTFKADFLRAIDYITKDIGRYWTNLIKTFQSSINLIRASIGRLVSFALKVIWLPIKLVMSYYSIVMSVIRPIIDFFTKMYDKLADGFNYVANGIKKAFEPIKNWYQKYIADFVAYMRAIYNVSIKPFIQKIITPIVNVFNKVKGWFDNLINDIKDKFTEIFREVKFEDHLLGLFKGLFTVKNVFTEVFTYIKDFGIWVFKSITTQPVQFFKSMFADILDTFRKGVVSLVEKIPDIDKSFFGINLHEIKKGLGGVGSAIGGTIANLRKDEDKLLPKPQMKSLEEILTMSTQQAIEYMDKLRAEVESHKKVLEKNKKATEENTNELKISDDWKRLVTEAARRQFNIKYNQITPSITIKEMNVNDKSDVAEVVGQMSDKLEEFNEAAVAVS